MEIPRATAKAIREEHPMLLPSTLGFLSIPGYQHPTHLQRLQRAVLTLLTSDNLNRLLIQMPVRHGKSHYCSLLVPAWFLIMRPRDRVLVVTYGQDFALDWGSKVLPLVAEWGPPLTGAVVSPNFCGAANFRMQGSDGGFAGLGVHGALAGRGASLIVCDDLVKDQSLAQSPVQREKLFSTFWSEVMTRLEPGGKVIVIMSRRHPEDLSGRLIDMNEELEPSQQWHLIDWPAIRTEEDGTEHALWPERYSLNALQKIRHSLEVSDKSWQWYCLYQNDPMGDPAFKDFPEHYFKEIFYNGPRPSTPVRFKLMSLDPSCGSDKKTGDYAACLYGVVDRAGTIWIEDSFMETAPSPVVEDMCVAMIEREGPDGVIIETNNFQDLIADNVIRKCEGKQFVCPIHRHVNRENKESRIRISLSHLLAQGKIRFKSTPANKLIVRQLREFPTGGHDDGPDSLEIMTRLIRYLTEGVHKPAPDYEPLVF